MIFRIGDIGVYRQWGRFRIGFYKMEYDGVPYWALHLGWIVFGNGADS